MSKNQVFFDNISEEMTEIFMEKYGEISKDGKINYSALKIFCYQILCNKFEDNKCVREIIKQYINDHNDNSVQYDYENGFFTVYVSKDVIHNVALVLSPYFAKDYKHIVRLARFVGLSDFEGKDFCKGNKYLSKKQFDYLIELYKELYEVYDEEEETYIYIAFYSLFNIWDFYLRKLATLGDIFDEKRITEEIAIKALFLTIKALTPIFYDLYRDVFSNTIIVDYLNIIFEANIKRKNRYLKYMDFNLLKDFIFM